MSQVVRLGAAVPVSDRISWLPPEARGWVPLHCYLVRAGEVDGRERAVLVDTSYPAIQAQVLGHLERELPPGSALTMVLTRQAEYESIGNAAAVLQRFEVTEAWGNNAPEENLYFSPRHSPMRQPQRGPWWPHGAELRTAGFGGSAGLQIGEHRFEWISAPLRLLATVWVFHHNSGTLFSSDAFATGCLTDAHASPVVEEVVWDDDLLRAYLMAKFGWVERADLTTIVAELDELLERLDVRCVAPSHGWIVRGPAARRLLEGYRAILAEHCRTPTGAALA